MKSKKYCNFFKTGFIEDYLACHEDVKKLGSQRQHGKKHSKKQKVK